LFFGGSVGATPALAAEKKKKKDKDNVVGTIWAYKLKKDDKAENGQFRVYKLEVFKGDKKVGKVVPKDEDETKLIITEYEPLNGAAILRKTRTKPPVWKGTLVKDDGSKWSMEVEIKNK